MESLIKLNNVVKVLKARNVSLVIMMIFILEMQIILVENANRKVIRYFFFFF